MKLFHKYIPAFVWAWPTILITLAIVTSDGTGVGSIIVLIATWLMFIFIIFGIKKGFIVPIERNKDKNE